jgi:hypothetical protein
MLRPGDLGDGTTRLTDDLVNREMTIDRLRRSACRLRGSRRSTASKARITFAASPTIEVMRLHKIATETGSSVGGLLISLENRITENVPWPFPDEKSSASAHQSASRSNSAMFDAALRWSRFG